MFVSKHKNNTNMLKTTLLIIGLAIHISSHTQVTLYVNPDAPSSGSADGTISNPYNDIASSVDLAAASSGGDVVIIDGEYDMTDKSVTITAAATPSTVVTIKPQTTGGVKLNFVDRFGFEFHTDSRYITLEGLELNGRTDEIDYWSIVALGFWGDSSVQRNGGLAIIIDGQHINIIDNYIHDWYQKAVEIRDARYAVVKGNIIHNIATTSLTGGHGIMRQQKGQECSYRSDRGGGPIDSSSSRLNLRLFLSD